MQRTRRKQFNAIDAPALARWIIITGFLAATGLIYVHFTVQLYHLGDRKRSLENELISLRSQNDVASGQIATLTSRAALQRRLKEGHLKMIPIVEPSIVRLNNIPGAPAEETLQAVVNKPLR